MEIVVIGLGSMGKRRIRLIKELYPEYTIYGIDAREDRRKEVEDLHGMCCMASISDVAAKFNIDAAFVCTAPISHAAIIRECLKNKWHVFTEINLIADEYENNILLAQENNCVLFLSSTFLYRDEIQYIDKKIDEDEKWNYIYHVGQYLPDWHPWENYKDFFVGDKRTNGCREIMAIELPWIINVFGKVKRFHVLSDKMTDLNIEYNDNYMIQFEHENGNKGVFVVDVVSPIAERKLEVYSENRYIQWSGTPESLLEYDMDSEKLVAVDLNVDVEHVDGYRAFIIENAYKDEIKEFIEVIHTGKKARYGFAEDMDILNLINKVEES